MEEELICSKCSITWKRLKTRGRKPLFCPSCLQSPNPAPIIEDKTAEPVISEKTVKKDLTPKSVFESLYPKPSNYNEFKESTKNGSKWKCPSCNAITILHVAVTAPPTHKCTPDMVSVKICERIE